MTFNKRETIYFQAKGKENTDELLDFVCKYAETEHIQDIVVASTTGETGCKTSRLFKGKNLVIVTHSYGFPEPGKTELLDEYKKEIIANGAKIFTGTHALSSAERAIRRDFNTIQPLELIASVLRLLGEGTKVCVEIALMAADAGLIPVDKDIIAISGSGGGADTALRLQPANSARFFNLRVKEIIAKPSNF